MPGSKQPEVQIWEATSPHGVLILCCDEAEPSARHDDWACRLTDARYTVAAVDPGQRLRGRSGLKAAVADVARVLDAQAQDHPGLKVFLLGHSRGAAPALGYAVAHSERLAGLILSAPLAQVPPGRLSAMLHGASSSLLPDAPVMALDPQRINPDARTSLDLLVNPLTQLGPIAASSAAENSRREARLMDGLDTIELATLLLWGVQEGLTPPGGAEHLLGALTHADLTRHSFDSPYHDLLTGPARGAVLDTIISWLDGHGSRSPAK
jgi:acylglycerol lipase